MGLVDNPRQGGGVAVVMRGGFGRVSAKAGLSCFSASASVLSED